MSITLVPLAKRRVRAQKCDTPISNRAATAFSEAGQATVEFAFSITIFLMLLFGFLGLAIVFFSWLSVANAAREGARYVIANPTAADSQVKTYICSTTVILGGSSAGCNSLLSSGGLKVTIEPTQSARISNSQISVKVEYQVPVPTLRASFIGGGGFTFLGPITVTSLSAMRIE